MKSLFDSKHYLKQGRRKIIFLIALLAAGIFSLIFLMPASETSSDGDDSDIVLVEGSPEDGESRQKLKRALKDGVDKLSGGDDDPTNLNNLQFIKNMNLPPDYLDKAVRHKNHSPESIARSLVAAKSKQDSKNRKIKFFIIQF